MLNRHQVEIDEPFTLPGPDWDAVAPIPGSSRLLGDVWEELDWEMYVEQGRREKLEALFEDILSGGWGDPGWGEDGAYG